MTLEEEAREYANKYTEDSYFQAHESFLAGANSKWVQAEKIKAQIEMLYTCIELTDTGIRNKANELEQQLKELEDESKD
jgi:hypothetical protein